VTGKLEVSRLQDNINSGLQYHGVRRGTIGAGVKPSNEPALLLYGNKLDGALLRDFLIVFEKVHHLRIGERHIFKLLDATCALLA
jgi:hypothetical protein